MVRFCIWRMFDTCHISNLLLEMQSETTSSVGKVEARICNPVVAPCGIHTSLLFLSKPLVSLYHFT